MRNKMKVYVTDDHVLMRDGLVKLLQLENDLEIVGKSDNGAQCLSDLKKNPPDLLLLDISMPEMSGIEVLKEFSTFRTDKTRVLMLTMHDDYGHLYDALTYGADGYVLKDVEFDILLEAVRAVGEGNIFIQPQLAQMLAKEVKKSHEETILDLLTNRERQIYERIAMGESNRQIADRLVLSEKTVKNHVSNLFRKIQVNDRTQAAIYAVKNNLF